MEILKKSLFIIFVLSVVWTSGQGLEEAFESSYELENKAEYAKAADVLKAMYDESSYEINLRLGWLSYLAGSYVESISYYNKSIVLKPYAIEPRFGLALPTSAMGNWQAVMTQYEKILEVDPRNTVANYRLGLLYYNSEQYDTALKYFEKVVNLYPFDYDSVIMFAWTYLKLGKTREAEVLFKKALLMRPGDDSANEGLSLIK